MARSSVERLDGGGRKARGDGTGKEIADTSYTRQLIESVWFVSLQSRYPGIGHVLH